MCVLFVSVFENYNRSLQMFGDITVLRPFWGGLNDKLKHRKGHPAHRGVYVYMISVAVTAI